MAGTPAATPPNVIARALNPNHGVVFYRAFVYDITSMAYDPKNEPRQSIPTDNFHPLDGQFRRQRLSKASMGQSDSRRANRFRRRLSGLEKKTKSDSKCNSRRNTRTAAHLCFLIPIGKKSDF